MNEPKKVERTRREFIDKLKERQDLWEQFAGRGTNTETKEAVLKRTAEVILMGDEIARINTAINEMETERRRLIEQVIDEHPLGERIKGIHRKIEDKTLQAKSIKRQMDAFLAEMYGNVRWKLGDIMKYLDLPEEEVGMEVQ